MSFADQKLPLKKKDHSDQVLKDSHEIFHSYGSFPFSE